MKDDRDLEQELEQSFVEAGHQHVQEVFEVQGGHQVLGGHQVQGGITVLEALAPDPEPILSTTRKSVGKQI